MSDHISDAHGVKSRRSHACRVCSARIEPGAAHVVYRGVERGEGFYVLRFHPDCWSVSRNWDECDWESCEPMRPEEVQEALLPDAEKAGAR